MILALLLVAAPGPSAADAEHAFAAAAQAGQWAAFRAFATEDAVMFLPRATNAQAWLKDRKESRNAVMWWAADSFVACNGDSAVNTGPWVRPWAKAVGYFTTVWQRQSDGGWKWTMDSGDGLATPRPAGDGPKTHRASCKGRPGTVAAVRYADGDTGEGHSADRTLAWRWHVAPDGSRSVDAWLWDGHAMRSVVADRIAAQ